MIQRTFLQPLTARMMEPRKFLQVLFGPRQVGKTTIVRQLLRTLPFESMYVAADNVPAAGDRWISNTWNEARRKCSAGNGREFLLVIDEIQKINNWSEVVKKEWDNDTFNEINLKVIVLGSSRLLLQQGLTESLAGRFETSYLTHWSYREMRDAFGWNVQHYIWYGGYPGAADLSVNEQRWRSYINDALIETSISKDILMLTRVEKPALLRRLFEIGSTFSAQIVSLNKVQGELQETGNLTTLANYLKLLESSGLLAGLEKYAGNTIRKRSSKPKFQVFNNALMNAKAPMSYADTVANPMAWGRCVESAVGTHLLNTSMTERYNLFYWNESSYEVDYLLEKDDKLVGIEVKSGKDGHSRGMELFRTAYPSAKMFTVGTGGIPLEEFLLSNPAQLLDI